MSNKGAGREDDERLTALEYEVERVQSDVTDIKKTLLTIVDKLGTLKPPTEIKTILYVVGMSVTITSAVIGAGNWLISNQMQVPLKEIEALKKMMEKTNQSISKVGNHQQIILNEMGTLKDKVKSNTDFTNQYMFIDKVPVQQQKLDGRLEMLETQMDMINTSIHNGRLIRKGGR